MVFDDCARYNEARPKHNILRIYDANTGKSIPVKKAIEDGFAFPADTLLALTDKNYYINLVKQALDKFAERA